jgi:[acyl-carrier-protein] S-malonyltransferase
LAETIDWAACLDGLRERGCTVLLELGPGAGLARMARDRMPDIPARSVAEFNSLDGVLDWVGRQLD